MQGVKRMELSSEKIKYAELEQFIKEKNNDKSELIAVLHKAQHIFGYLPREVQKYIADKLNIPEAKVYGVVSFYSFFTMTKRGKFVINVCLGTACFVRGSDKILAKFEEKLGINSGETTKDGKYTLETLRCVGACGLAPVIQVNGKTYGNATLITVDEILQEYK
jgi:NADH-quinone oxidoreductase subunit E